MRSGSLTAGASPDGRSVGPEGAESLGEVTRLLDVRPGVGKIVVDVGEDSVFVPPRACRCCSASCLAGTGMNWPRTPAESARWRTWLTRRTLRTRRTRRTRRNARRWPRAKPVSVRGGQNESDPKRMRDERSVCSEGESPTVSCR